MSACPNKNSKEWENLLEQVDGNEVEAEYAFIKNGYEIPTDIDAVRKEEEYVFDQHTPDQLKKLTDARTNIIHALHSKYAIYRDSDNDAYIEELETLIRKFTSSNYEIAFSSFVEKAQSNVNSLKKKMENDNSNPETLNLMNNFVGTFELIKDVIPLMDDNNIINFDPELIRKAERLSSSIGKFKARYNTYANNSMVDILAARSTRERENKRMEFSKEYEILNSNSKRDSLFETNKRKYVEDKLHDAADEILRAEKNRLRIHFTTSPVDISAFTKLFVDGRSVNEPIVQLLVNMIDEADFNSNQDFIEDKRAANKIHQAFLSGDSVDTKDIGNINEVISKLKNNQNFIKLSADEKNYVNTKTGKKYERVTSYISDSVVMQNDILTSAGKIGTKVDEMIRDYFSTNDFNKNKYDVIPDDIKDSFISQLAELEEKFKESGETVVSEDILLFDDEIGVAGTVDILKHDKDGNFRIYDMKTMRKEQHVMNEYGELLYDNNKVFEDTGEKKEDGSPKMRIVKGKTRDSNRVKHSKQLSMYSHLLKSQTGKGATELGIIPIKVQYNGGDTVSTEGDIKEIVNLNHTKVKKLNITKEAKSNSASLFGEGVNRKGLITKQKKLYEGIIEKIDGKETQYYVSKFFSTYNNELREKNKEVSEIKLEIKDEIEQKKAVRIVQKKWDNKHLIDPYLKKGKYESSNVKDEFKNPQFKELDSNPSRKEMYDFLIEFNRESDSMVNRGRLGYKLPSMTQSSVQKLSDKGLKEFAKDKYEDITKLRVDEEGYGDLTSEDGVVKVLTDQFGNELKRISIPFRGNLEVNDQSYDLMGMALSNRAVSRNFKEKNAILPTAEIIKSLMGSRKVGKRKGKDAIKRSFKKLPGIKDEEIEDILDTIEGSDSESYKLLEGIIDSRIYGRSNVMSSSGVWVDKGVNALITASSHTLLIANWFGATSNVISGKTMNFLESAKGRYGVFSKSDLLKAEHLYWGDIGAITKDAGEYDPKSRTNQLLEKFVDTSMNFSTMANDLTKDTKFKRLNNVGTLHAFNGVAEHYIQGTLIYGALNNIKIKNKKGQYIGKNGTVVATRKEAVGMWYGYQNGKDGLQWNNSFTVEGYSSVNRKTEAEINSKIKDVLADLQGMYDKNNKSLSEREWYGKAATFLRRWMVRGTQRRWRGIGIENIDKDFNEIPEHNKFYSEGAQSYKEGTYVSMLRYVVTSYKSSELLKGKLTLTDWNGLSDMEKGNIKSGVVELALLFGSLIAAKFLAGLAKNNPDEEEKEDLYMAAYFMRRLYGDLSMYLPVLGTGDALRTLRTPSATFTVLESINKIGSYLLDDISEMEVQLYEKGENKDKSKTLTTLFDLVIPGFKQFGNKAQDKYLFISNQQ